ncbi:hypothetical protein ACFQBS_34805 [Planomonospora parontospora]|uniref:hypothetical protein n=1 Tax=Planomonospora parontospora TaxID=58119 RepID=UPI00361FF826
MHGAAEEVPHPARAVGDRDAGGVDGLDQFELCGGGGPHAVGHVHRPRGLVHGLRPAGGVEAGPVAEGGQPLQVGGAERLDAPAQSRDGLVLGAGVHRAVRQFAGGGEPPDGQPPPGVGRQQLAQVGGHHRVADDGGGGGGRVVLAADALLLLPRPAEHVVADAVQQRVGGADGRPLQQGEGSLGVLLGEAADGGAQHGRRVDVLPQLGADPVVGQSAGQRREVAGIEAKGAGEHCGGRRSAVQPRQVETEDWGADQGIHETVLHRRIAFNPIDQLFITKYHGALSRRYF